MRNKALCYWETVVFTSFSIISVPQILNILYRNLKILYNNAGHPVIMSDGFCILLTC